MNSDKLCATPSWQSVDWKRAKTNVSKVQSRIAQAVLAGRYGKARSLQRILVRSFYARALAVKRVTESRGKHTSGIDGEVWTTPEEKYAAITRLGCAPYRAKPLKTLYIPKKNGSLRKIAIPTMLDRAMLTLYALALEPVAEVHADPNSYGFRAGRSAQDAIGQAVRILGEDDSPRWVLEADIFGCFDNIAHRWLLDNAFMDRRMLKMWLNCGEVYRGKFSVSRKGIPQGSALSPMLMNVVLDGLEDALGTEAEQERLGINLIRYADDFIITAFEPETLQNIVIPVVRGFLAKRGLMLSAEKTGISHIEDGIVFLGVQFRRYREGLIYEPSLRAADTFLAKVEAVIAECADSEQYELIKRLTPKIRGWASNYRGLMSFEAFEYVDGEINGMLMDWARRRHEGKNDTWIAKRYFQQIRGNVKTFACRNPRSTGSGKNRYVVLAKAVDTPMSIYCV